MKRIATGKTDPSIEGVLKKLVQADLDFCVIGGLLCQYYLKDHARRTKDVDILFLGDWKTVEEKLKAAFGTIDFTYNEETETFYEPSFTGFVKIGGLLGQVEGKRIDFLPEVKTDSYSYQGIVFPGVCLEYAIAEKLVAVLNELPRPYKHLVDVYSFSHIDPSLFDKGEIQRYMSLINDQENRFRKRAGIKEYVLPKQIPITKRFAPPFVVPTLQAKYNVSQEEMVAEVNEWLKTVM
ncbi:MAG: nucleotidyl transferase AbiEii/AbiGii toxin family protein [Erysipelotrichaceae bacterium]|nr:nucleotidyl transferase AbiEii/AbiGii toxin family protein [Erysipelotrichaceae bacterium]